MKHLIKKGKTYYGFLFDPKGPQTDLKPIKLEVQTLTKFAPIARITHELRYNRTTQYVATLNTLFVTHTGLHQPRTNAPLSITNGMKIYVSSDRNKVIGFIDGYRAALNSLPSLTRGES